MLKQAPNGVKASTARIISAVVAVIEDPISPVLGEGEERWFCKSDTEISPPFS